MKTPTKFVKELTEAQRQELNAVMNTGNRQLRTRAHTILLSSRKFSIDEIANIYEVDRDTVSLWLDRWEKTGLDGLKDQAGRGRPPNSQRKRTGTGDQDCRARPAIDQKRTAKDRRKNQEENQCLYTQTVAQEKRQSLETHSPQLTRQTR